MKTSGTMNSATGHTSVSTRTGNFNDGLYDRAGARPDLDLDFARTKSLKDRVSKEDLITFTRSSGNTGYGATYVDENGLLKVAPVNLLKHSEDSSNGIWTKGNNTTINANVAVAPDGTNTANRIQMSATGSTFMYQLASLTVGETYTASVYVKSTGTSSNFNMLVFANGTYVAASYTSSQTTTPTEWTRYELTFTATNSSTQIGMNNLNDTWALDAYVWGWQVEKGSVATEYIPTTSQFSGAPRFTHDPLTKESKGLLIEQAATNLIFPSEDFSGYQNYNSSVTTDQIIAPDGTQTADKIQWDNSGGNPIAYKPKPANGVYTISAFFKKGNSDGAIIYADNPAFRCAIFDLENGTTGPKHGTFSKTTIEDFGNGWYRCSATTTAISGNNVGFGVCEKEQTNTTLVNPSTTDSHNYVWGSQVEAGIVLTSYIPTSGSTVTRSPDLLSIEGDNFGTYRTNIVTNTSFRKGSNGWVTTGGFANSTYESYAALSPSGNYDALKVTATGSTSVQHRVQQVFGDISVSGSTTDLYSISGYFKKGTADRIFFSLYDGNDTKGATFVDLTNGTTYSPTGTNVSITDVGQETGDSRLNGWYKVQLTSNQVTSGNASVLVTILDGPSNNFTYIANGESIFLWGFQVELADAPTEFIPSTDTFTNRQSNATFVDGNGIIRTSLVNLIKYSEAPDDATWAKNSTGGNSVFSATNNVIAPDGTLTADTWTADATKFGYFDSTTVTSSPHVPNRWMDDPVTGVQYPSLYEADGSSQTVDRIPLTSEWVRHSIQVTTLPQQTQIRIYPLRRDGPIAWIYQLLTVLPETTYTYSAWYKKVGTKVYVWGLQFVKGSEAGDYHKTTNTISGPPRYSHDPDTLTPTGLYLEAKTTNDAIDTERFGSGYEAGDEDSVFIAGPYHYSNSTRKTETGITNPDGSTDGTTVLTVDSGTHNRQQPRGFRLPNIASLTGRSVQSVFVKRKTSTARYVVLFLGGTGTYQQCMFDFDTETVVENTAPHNLADHQQYNATDRMVERGVVKYPNGWYRLYLIIDVPNVIAGNGYGVGLAKDPATSKSVNQTDDGPYDGTEAIYVWGLNRCSAEDVDSSNVPQETHLSSYIKNSQITTSSVTRTTDIFTSTATEVLDRANGTKPAFFTTEGLTLRCDCQFNDMSETASYVNDAGATIYPSSHVYNRVFQFNDLSNNTLWYAFANNYASYTNPRVPIFAVFGGDFYVQQVHDEDFDLHVVLRYQANNSNLRITNTTNNGADTNMTTLKAGKLTIGGAQSNAGTGSEMNGTIKRFTIWKIPFDETEPQPSSIHHKMVKLAQ